MKKFITSVLASVGLIASTAVVGIAPAQAQYYASATCVARSEYAVGRWTAYNPDQACANAIYQCQIRTPSYGTCYIVRMALVI